MDEELDISGAVQMLQNMLAGEEGQQQLQNIMQMLGGGPPDRDAPGQATGGINPQDLDMALRLQRVMARLNHRPDSSQAQLLLALKPFLKPSRREKVDSAMKLLRLTQVMEILREVQGE